MYKSRFFLPLVAACVFAILFWGALLIVSLSPEDIGFGGPFALSVNGEQISWQTFKARTAYAQALQGIKDKKQARKVASESLIEDTLIRQEARKRAIEPNTDVVDSRLEGRNDEQTRYAVQTAFLKEQLETKVIAKRSGKAIMVSFGFDIPGMELNTQKSIAQAKISDARRRINGGQAFEKVGEALDSDPEVQKLNNGIALIPFTDWERGKILYSQAVTDVVFATPQGTVSDIIAVENDPNKYGRKPDHKEFAYAIVMVDRISDGGEPTYAAWLTNVKQQSTIINNVK